MTTVGKSMFPLKTSFHLLSGMKQRYDQLQGQLATGQKAATLAEMGSTRFFNMSMRARISSLESYEQTMGTIGLRLSVLDTTLSRLDKIESEQRTSATPGGAGTNNINFATVPATSRARLDEVLDLLNAHVGGRYLFGGNTTDRRPVLTAAALLDGVGGQAGFKTVAHERLLADTGANGLGRLEVEVAGNTVTLDEDGAHPFGLKLGALSSSSADVAFTQPDPDTPPRTASVQFGAVPPAGSKVTLAFTLPDGTVEQLVLTAVNGAPGAGKFQLGDDADSTAANFKAALETSIDKLVETKGAAASAFAAADNFFNGHGDPVRRVDGPPYETATGFTSANTVQWYAGGSSDDPRGSVTGKVDDGTSVRYGVEANEAGLLGLVRSLAVMATATFSNDDPTAAGRFDAMAERQIERLSATHTNQPGSIKVIAVELGMAQTTMANTAERHQTHKAQLQTMLAELEQAPLEEVAMELLALKVRLEASYQATAMVAQLSFVNYMR